MSAQDKEGTHVRKSRNRSSAAWQNGRILAQDSRGVPAVQAIRGFHEARFLTDAHTGTVIGVTVWETEADAKAAPVGAAEGGPLRDLLTTPAVVPYYELSMGFARDTCNF